MKNPLQQGFSLIEIMLSLFILCVGLLGLLKFKGTIWHYVAAARQQAEAVRMGNRQLELLRSFEVITTTSGFAAYNDIASGSGTSSGVDTTYTNSWTVTTFTNPNYKKADVTVSWADRSGASQNISLSTIIAEINPLNGGVIMENAAGGF